MVSFPDLSVLPSSPTPGDFFAFPNTGYAFYWAWVLGGIWLILTMSLYFKEKLSTGRSNLLSAMAVSSFGLFSLSIIGSIVGFIPLNLMVYLIVFCVVIIAVWIWSTTRSN